jgi:hypothetical protein
MGGSTPDRNLRVLVALCEELIKLGVKVGLSDARPALSVRGALVERKLWIEVDPTGEAFIWRQDDRVGHAVDDPSGAAEAIAEYLNRRDAGPEA